MPCNQAKRFRMWIEDLWSGRAEILWSPYDRTEKSRSESLRDSTAEIQTQAGIE